MFDIAAEKVRPFYAALKEFDDLLNSTEHKFTYKLKQGQQVASPRNDFSRGFPNSQNT